LNKELFYISLFNNRYIGDDGASIEGYVYSADAFFENVHFKREWMSEEEVAYKAMLVNISDAVAMNADVKYAFVTLSIPKDFTPQMIKRLALGFKKAACEYGFEIAGGDTVASDRLEISVTLVSKTKKPIFRKPVKEGYLLAYTGELGRAAKELKRLQRGGRVSKRGRFKRPAVRREFMKRASRHIKAAMDISDGLFDDLYKLSKINKIGFEFLKPISKPTGCSGEEYELLFAFDARDWKKIEQAARKSRTKVTLFARAKRVKYRNICRPHHF